MLITLGINLCELTLLTKVNVMSIYATQIDTAIPERIMKTLNFKSTILVGLTTEGKKFRPSDWAERMCGSLSTFRNRRIYYSPLLRPAIRDGIKCVIVDETLLEKEPGVHQQIFNFAETNRLQIIYE